jgi:hypothetical protein
MKDWLLHRAIEAD